MQNFLLISTRRWKEILAFTVLTSVLALLFGYFYNGTSFNNTIFINIGAKQLSGFDTSVSPFETVQAADSFTESVQGWFKNPSLIEKIRKGAGYEVDLSVRKQEKQNLVITYKTATADEGKKIAQTAEEAVRGEIGKYNRDTGSEFGMPVFDLFTKEGIINPAIFIIIGAALGLLIGYAYGFLIEKLLAEVHQFRHGKS